MGKKVFFKFCTYFHTPQMGNSWFTYHGIYHTTVAAKVTRYRCKKCGRTFGYRTFHRDYYTKKTINYVQLMASPGVHHR